MTGKYWEAYKQTLHEGSDNPSKENQVDDLDHGGYEKEYGPDDDRSDRIPSSSGVEDIGEDLLWQQLAQELQRQQEEGQVQSASEEEAAAAREITEEEEHVVSTAASALSQVRHPYSLSLHFVISKERS